MRTQIPTLLTRACAPLAACILLIVANAASTRAQTNTQPPATAATPPQTAITEPDLSITARVTARELRFEKVPNPKVEFTGKPERQTAWEAERENLPAQVQPGVTYRNIGITLRITSVFQDIERIVAEALGEIPVSEDSPASPSQNPPLVEPKAQVVPSHVAPQTLPVANSSATSKSQTRPRSARRGTRR